MTARWPVHPDDWPPLEATVNTLGAVVCSTDHPAYAKGDHLGDVATHGEPVWIGLDGWGGSADDFDRAVEEVIDAAVRDARKRYGSAA